MGKIKIKKQNEGKFTAWARAHGMTVQEAARHILANREKYSSTLIKRANFARNAAKWEEGGMFEFPSLPDYKSGGIHINPANKGKFNATKKRTGKSTEELTHSKNPKTRKRAIFAQNAKKWKHEDGGIHDEYGLGGFVQSLSGIASLIPGIGGIASGVLSGLGGVLAGQEQKKAQFEAASNKAKQVAAAGQANIVNNYPSVFKVGGTFKGKRFGGKPNAEVEGGEVIITPDGDTTNMYGNSHAQGGIDVNLPNNTLILSDKVKIGKGQTAADVARPYTNKINKAKEIMVGNATRLSKESSKLNLNKYYAKVFDAFNKQESKKLQKFDGGGWYAPLKLAPIEENNPVADLIYPFPKGDAQYPYKVAGNGANVIDKFNFTPGTPKVGGGSTEKAQFPGDVAPVINRSDYPQNLGFINEGLSKINIPTLAKPVSNKLVGASGANDIATTPIDNNNDWVDKLSVIGELAPTLFNVGQGLFGEREQLDANKYRNPYESQINSLMANRRYNIDPDLIANENAFRTTAANMRNLGGSRGQVMSNLTGAQNVKQFSDMSAYSMKNNMENQYAGEYANMLYGLGRDKSTTAMTVDDINASNRAVRRNAIASGMTGLQQYLLTKRQMKNQAARDKMFSDAIRAYSRYTDKWLPDLNNYLNNLNNR